MRIHATAVCALLFITLSTSAQTKSTWAVTGSKEDEAAVRAIVDAEENDRTNEPRIAPDLDWENAFGGRYNNLETRNKFLFSTVATLQKDATSNTIEVKVSFVEPTVAVADTYWHVIGQIDQTTNKPGADRWGRTTYILKKTNGNWALVIERVTDLRRPYYKHFATLPTPVPVPTATLASYAGTWGSGADQTIIAVSGDHLVVTRKGRTANAIPISPTEFLVFREPEFLEYYYKMSFRQEGTGPMTIFYEGASGEPLGRGTKAN